MTILKTFTFFRSLLLTLTCSFIALQLSGCASPGKGVLPQDKGTTMVGVYEQETGQGGGGGVAEGGDTPSYSETMNNAYTRVALKKSEPVTEIVGDAGEYYKPVENVSMKLYVYPHRTYNQDGEESIVPGYYTYFPLYSHQHYYLPNEAY